MSSAVPLVLGVDLDGVCADYEGAFRASVARQFDRPLDSMPPQTVMDAYSQWGLTFEAFEEAHRRAVLEDRIFRHMAPLPGVSDALWQLSDAGVWIRIITHRLIFNWAHETSAADTAAWLDAHQIPYRDLCFIGDKPNVGADLYVDDSPANIISLRAAGRTAIVFDQPYNRELPAPRAHSWEAVVELVVEELDARSRQLSLPWSELGTGEVTGEVTGGSAEKGEGGDTPRAATTDDEVADVVTGDA